MNQNSTCYQPAVSNAQCSHFRPCKGKPWHSKLVLHGQAAMNFEQYQSRLDAGSSLHHKPLPYGLINSSQTHSLCLIIAGTRPSRLRSLTQAGDAEPNRMSTSNSDTRMRFQGSPDSAPSVVAPALKGLTVRTRVKSEHSSDGTGSARTPGSVNIRVWKVSLL